MIIRDLKWFFWAFIVPMLAVSIPAALERARIGARVTANR